jgi:hypothetical protein
VLNDRMDLHLARLHAQVSWSRQAAPETLARVAFPTLSNALTLKTLNDLEWQRFAAVHEQPACPGRC